MMARQTNRRAGDVYGESPILEEWAAAACMGKQAFDSAQLAHHVAAKRRVPSGHYRCRVCGKYHVYSGRKK